MKNNVKINEQKMQEYKEILGVIKETINSQDMARICLNNNTLRTLAGYTEESTDENFNEYVKQYIDKLSYDEHNKKVDEAKKTNNEEELKRLSREVMSMAGYLEGAKGINTFAKSFVDRTLLDKQLAKLYKALQVENKEAVQEAYKRIYNMTSFSSARPYGVVNEYAQSFVENRLDKYVQMGIHMQDKDEKYAI